MNIRIYAVTYMTNNSRARDTNETENDSNWILKKEADLPLTSVEAFACIRDGDESLL